MKYFADYMKERVYAVDEKTGIGVMVDEDGRYNIQKKIVPWFEEENETIWEVESMTKEEFYSYGKKWKWAKAPSSAEMKKHSWRNYMEKIRP